MSDGTKIEWTDATWNIITGCSIKSKGCTNCYAMKLAGTRLQHHPSREGLTKPSAAGPVWNGMVRFNPRWLSQPLTWARERQIFVCAHGDLFHEAVPDAWIDKVFAVMAEAHWHTFQVLTKRSDRMLQYLTTPGRARTIHDALIALGVADAVPLLLDGWNGDTWPLPNVWLGVSVEDQDAANERIPDLLSAPAAVRWISAEPLLGPVDLTQLEVPVGKGCDVFSALEYDGAGDDDVQFGTATVDWVVVGGESGARARPMSIQWARELRDQCAAASVSFLFKQWGEWAPAGLHQAEAPGKFAFGDYEHDRERFVETDAYPRQFTMFGARCVLERVGKKAAGRQLDGRTHDEYPPKAMSR